MRSLAIVLVQIAALKTLKMNKKETNLQTDDQESIKQLEQEKLKAEIENLKKPIYHKSSFYAAMLPVLLGVITLIFSAASGYFDVRIDKIKVQEERLEYQKEKLKDSIAILAENYKFKEAEYKQYVDELTAEHDSIQSGYTKKSDSISNENSKVKIAFDKNVNDLKNIQLTENDLRIKLEESYSAQKNQITELNNLKSKLSNSETKITNLESNKQELQQRINLIESKKSPWILITEKKPLTNRKIFLYSENPVGWFNNVRVGYYNTKNKGFYILNGKYANITKLATHWKYIELPKE